MEIWPILNRLYKKTSQNIDEGCINICSFIKQNAYLIISLSILAITVYGFELFNFNLTIDEEVHATYSGPIFAWIEQGRWGMYLLNKILLPYTVIPFVPLFMAIVFHILAIILLVNLWGNYSKTEKVIIGSICLAYPGIAYVYTFSTMNYGIGFGLFCCALSLFLFTKNKGLKVFYAIIPAAFAVSIYQGLIPTIIAIYLVYLINLLLYQANDIYKKFVIFLTIIIAALVFSQIIQKIVLRIYAIAETSYVSSYFDIHSIINNIIQILGKFLLMMFKVYSGDKSIYALEVSSLRIILLFSLFGFIIRVAVSKSLFINKVFAICLIIGLIIIPFLSGFLMNGYYAMRFLVALPMVIAGIIALGVNIPSSLYKLIFLIISIFCVSQFMQSSNHLFASSNIALQADRLLGERLIEKIDNAKFDTNNPESIKYLEIIGYYERSSTQLIPKMETFGASFFEWDQGNTSRALLFLQTLGFQGLQTLPADRRSTMIGFSNAMPNWPEKGSVRVVKDTVLVKFGPYSNTQKGNICAFEVQKKDGDIFEVNSCVSKLFTP